jgi:long-subunit acyl-CoA synthetase (AMP-forming)
MKMAGFTVVILAYGLHKGSCKLLIGKRIFSSYHKAVRTMSQLGDMFCFYFGVVTDFCFTTLIEYVAPEKVENIMIQSLLVGQAFVYGDSLQSALVAVLIPDEDTVRNMLEKTGETALTKKSFAEICQDEKLKAIIMGEINKVGNANGLYGFEMPKAIHLDSDPFSVDNGLLTPTFKLKRQQAHNKYERHIEAMYAALPKPKSKI